MRDVGVVLQVSWGGYLNGALHHHPDYSAYRALRQSNLLRTAVAGKNYRKTKSCQRSLVPLG
jgi:hypothetical protein